MMTGALPLLRPSRRLPLRRRRIAFAFLALAIFEVAAWHVFPVVYGSFNVLAARLLPQFGFACSLVTLDVWGSAIPVATFVVPVHTSRDLAMWALGSLLLALAVGNFYRIVAPLRYFVAMQFAIVAVSAFALLMSHDFGYNGVEYARFIAQTTLGGWYLLPVLATFMTSLKPFSFAEQLFAMTLFCAYDMLLCGVRLTFFGALLGTAGVPIMPLLFFVYGLPLDACILAAVYGLLLYALTRRINPRVTV